jgi:hypothetical protein
VQHILSSFKKGITSEGEPGEDYSGLALTQLGSTSTPEQFSRCPMSNVRLRNSCLCSASVNLFIQSSDFFKKEKGASKC